MAAELQQVSFSFVVGLSDTSGACRPNSGWTPRPLTFGWKALTDRPGPTRHWPNLRSRSKLHQARRACKPGGRSHTIHLVFMYICYSSDTDNSRPDWHGEAGWHNEGLADSSTQSDSDDAGASKNLHEGSVCCSDGLQTYATQRTIFIKHLQYQFKIRIAPTPAQDNQYI